MHTRSQVQVVLGVIAAAVIAPAPLHAQAKTYEVRLKRAWVTKYANRATIDARMLVRHTHKTPNQVGQGGKDGDLHFSGESKEIGLPFVAEIVNARLPGQHAAIQDVKAKQADGDSVTITGAWRLWFEHPAALQTQGDTNAFDPDNTNPDHSFEIHPTSRVDQDDLSGSFVPIAGYHAYPADVAFPYYDKATITIKASESGISIRSKRVPYNYVEFNAELADDPMEVTDGFIVRARFLTDNDVEATDGLRRLIFVKGTPAANAIRNVSSGDRIRVLAIPRLDLNAILAMVNWNGTNEFQARLPYEMIVVGVLSPSQ